MKRRLRDLSSLRDITVIAPRVICLRNSNLSREGEISLQLEKRKALILASLGLDARPELMRPERCPPRLHHHTAIIISSPISHLPCNYE